MKMHCYYVVRKNIVNQETTICDFVAGPFATYHDAFDRYQEESRDSVQPELYKVVDMMAEVIG
jgi:hypothetical protein